MIIKKKNLKLFLLNVKINENGGFQHHFLYKQLDFIVDQNSLNVYSSQILLYQWRTLHFNLDLTFLSYIYNVLFYIQFSFLIMLFLYYTLTFDSHYILMVKQTSNFLIKAFRLKHLNDSTRDCKSFLL